jgi:hypothetical protein
LFQVTPLLHAYIVSPDSPIGESAFRIKRGFWPSVLGELNDVSSVTERIAKDDERVESCGQAAVRDEPRLALIRGQSADSLISECEREDWEQGQSHDVCRGNWVDGRWEWKKGKGKGRYCDGGPFS